MEFRAALANPTAHDDDRPVSAGDLGRLSASSRAGVRKDLLHQLRGLQCIYQRRRRPYLISANREKACFLRTILGNLHDGAVPEQSRDSGPSEGDLGVSDERYFGEIIP